MADTVQSGFGGLIDTLKSSAKKTEQAYGEHKKNVEKIAQDTRKIGDEYVKDLTLTADAVKDLGAITDSAIDKLDKGWMKWDGIIAGATMSLEDMWLDFATTPSFSEAFDEMAKGFKTMTKPLTEGGDAIKELTGGLVDINDIVDQGMKKVSAAWSLISAPIKLLNDGLTNTFAMFGVELDLLEKGKEFAIWGLKSLGGAMMKFGGMVLRQAGLLLARGIMFLVTPLITLGIAMLGFAAQMAMAVVGFVISSIPFIASLIGAGIAMIGAAIPILAAAAPIIGIALLIGLAVAALVWAGMKLYDMFIENKDFIYAKFNAMWQGVKDVIGSIVGFFTNIWQGISDFIREKFLKIKSFLGLTSDEEEQELADIKQRKADKEANAAASKKAAEEELALDQAYLDADDKTKKKMLKEKEAQLFKQMEQQTDFNNMDTQQLLDERNAKEAELEGKLAAMNAREQYMWEQEAAANQEVTDMQEQLMHDKASMMKGVTTDGNGRILEGAEKEAAIESILADKREAIQDKIAANEQAAIAMREKASLGILRDAEGNMVGGEEFAYVGQDKLDTDTTALSDEVGMMQKGLEGQEEYVGSREISELEVAEAMGYTPQMIEEAQRLIGENPEWGEMGLVAFLNNASKLGLTTWSKRGDYDEDFYRDEETVRSELAGTQDTTQKGRGEVWEDMEGSRRDLQKERNVAMVEDYRASGQTDWTKGGKGHMTLANISNTNNSGTIRMQDPVAINRAQSSSWGGSSMGDAVEEF